MKLKFILPLLVAPVLALSGVRSAHALLPLASAPVIVQSFDDNNGEAKHGYLMVLENGFAVKVEFFPLFSASGFTYGPGDPVKFQALLDAISGNRAAGLDSCLRTTPHDYFVCNRTTAFQPHYVANPVLFTEKPVTACGTYSHVSDPLLATAYCASVFQARTRAVQTALMEFIATTPL